MASPLPFQLGFEADDSESKVKVSRTLLPRNLEQYATSRSSVAHQARCLLFGTSKHISGIMGYHHPFFAQGTIHPSTNDALDSLIRKLPLGAVEAVAPGELTTNSLNGSAVILGGPVANAHARLIFGSGQISPLLGVALPVMFDVSKMSESIEVGEEQWRLIVEGRIENHVKECLVLTVIPMDEDRIVSIAGLHGAGTRAIELLLEDEKLLQNIERQVNYFCGWQAVIEVKARNAEIPTALGEVRIFAIDIDFSLSKHTTRSQMLFDREQLLQMYKLLPYSPHVDLKDFPAQKSVVSKLRFHSMGKTINDAHRRVNTRAFRESLAEVMEYLRYNKQPIVLTRNGRDIAALVSTDDLWILDLLAVIGVREILAGTHDRELAIRRLKHAVDYFTYTRRPLPEEDDNESSIRQK